ncbi:MAG: hypothetical protein JNJ54_18785 [Myxococcaceae bacterium]|nr:hypothetical protein [Myxococcaceae bacterium]
MRTSALIIAGLLAAGCTPGVGPIYVEKLRPIIQTANGCGLAMEETAIITRLDLIDVAATPDFEVVAALGGLADFFSNQSQPGVVLSDNRRLNPDARERLMVQRILLRYSSRPAIPGITATMTDTIPLVTPITRENTKVQLVIPLFGKNVRDQLARLSPSNTDPPYQFVSTFELQGTMMSGAEFRTDPVSFPMNLVKSEVNCTSPADPRLERYSPADRALSCNFVGLGKRIGSNFCCNNLDGTGNPALDFGRLGCDVLP